MNADDAHHRVNGVANRNSISKASSSVRSLSLSGSLAGDMGVRISIVTYCNNTMELIRPHDVKAK